MGDRPFSMTQTWSWIIDQIMMVHSHELRRWRDLFSQKSKNF